jgi:NAD(P)-dependent dehydrogenase (short-subunit alcohol dehydrogenase family)
MSIQSIDLTGKVAVVTGANSGIGKETARALSAMGATVILVCRNPEKAQLAAEDIATSTGKAVPEVVLCNMASMDSIRQATAQLNSQQDQIHILVNNAGCILGERRETPDGLEATFAINHMGYFLFTHQLLDKLLSNSARIVNVASDAHRWGDINFDDLQWLNRRYRPMAVYGTSKLMNILFNRSLAKRLEGTGVTSNALHPGVVGTGFGREGKPWLQLSMTLSKWLLRTPVRGASTSIYLATSPDVEGESGGYYKRPEFRNSFHRVKPRASACNDETAEQLWNASCEIAEVSWP